MGGPVSRRTVLALAAGGLAGCGAVPDGDDTPRGTANPALGDVSPRGGLELTSPAFDDGGPIPRAYGYDERNVNPPLRIAGVPDDAATLVLIMDDPDAVEAAGTVWVHWLVWNIDADRREIPAAWDGGDAVAGENDFGERGYGGPSPPDSEHTYRFKLYAVDRALDLPAAASAADVGAAIDGHVLAQTQLEGSYAP